MKKFLITGMALAMLAIPSVASADVQRCEASVPVKTKIVTATFTAIQPSNESNQWNRLWTHDFTVTINPEDNSFAGVGQVSGDDFNGTYDVQIPHVGDDLTVTGSYVNGKITLHATRPDGVVYNLTDAPTGDMGLSAPITVATLTKDGSLLSTPEPVEFKVSVPVVTETVTTHPWY